MRSLVRVGGVLLILSALALAGRSWSDTKRAATTPRTRVGLLNLQYVLKGYDKFKAFEDECKKIVEPLREREAETRRREKALTKEAASPTTTAARRTAIAKKLDTLRREIESIQSEMKEAVGKKQEERLKVLYGDLGRVVRRYARDHGLDLVLHYNDFTDEADRSSSENILRKMNAGATIPLYSAPGMDISKEIITALNDSARKAKGAGG